MNSSRVIKKIEEKQVWMFVSIDEEGRVLVSTVTKVLIVFNVTKLIIVDPKKMHAGAPKYTSIATRFL